MNHRPTEPLSAEERELAALLGRVGPHGEPSPSLDAKILAAAHDAVARDGARKLARRRRWPAITGLAASVLIAAGIGWQLLPRHEAAMQVGEAPAAVAAIDGHAEAADAAAAGPVAPPPPPPPPESKPSPPPIKQLAPPRAASLPAPAEPARERRYEAPPAVVAEPRPTDIVSSPVAALPPPPPPPAPPAPASVVMEQAPRAFAPAAAPTPAFERKQARASEAAAGAEAKAKAAANDSATLDSVVVSGSRTDEPDVLGIEVEADTHLAKRDWLHRIELRRTQGDTDGARESLRLFVKKYPRATLPSDLRGLLKE